MSQLSSPATLPPAIVRLAALAPLRAETVGLLRASLYKASSLRAGSHIQRKEQAPGSRMVIASGWACRSQTLPDGRRQIINLILPGDVIGIAPQQPATAPTNILALTDVTTFDVPKLAPGSGADLAASLAASSALDEALMFRVVTRLGRLSAYERTADLFLELFERLSLAGLTHGNSFPMPLTQQTLSDVLGLTPVHLNRVIQMLRRNEVLTLNGNIATIANLETSSPIVRQA